MKFNDLDIKQRLERRIITKDGCWITDFSLDSQGYSSMQYNNKRFLIHRLSYILYIGDIPKGLLVCHKCNNKRCINPDHLYAATQSQNVKDAYKDGLINYRRGENHHYTKLSDKEVIEIRKLYKLGGTSHRKLGKLFNVSGCTIGKIINNLSRKI